MEDLKQKEQNKTLPAPGGAEKNRKQKYQKHWTDPGKKAKKNPPEGRKNECISFT